MEYEKRPEWFRNWEKTGLLQFEDWNGDGRIQYYNDINGLGNARLALKNAEGETAKAEANRAPVVEERPALELEPMPKSFTAPPPTLAVLAQGNASALSPAVRKLVEEHNIDPKQVTGTGPKGRLLKTDLLTYLEGKPAASAAKSGC